VEAVLAATYGSASAAVAQQVADYVACVRAQGAKLSHEEGTKLSADVGVAGTHAGAASEVSDRLQREYRASDANTREIILACDSLARQAKGIAGPDVSGEWQSTFENGGEAGTVISFVQDGSKIRGTYLGGARYDGTLEGRVLSGLWVNGNSSGRFRFELSEDGKSFSGQWGFGTQDLKYWQRGQRR